jgi:tRNA(Ile)-lysidine synthase
LPRKGGFHITREARAVAAAACPTDAIWDHRWHLAGPHSPDLEVRALGKAGLSACTGWRSTGLPQASLLASPAIWRAAELVSAPLAGRLSGWSACLTRSPDDFFRGLIAH